MQYGIIPSTSNIPACLPNEATDTCKDDLVSRDSILKKMKQCDQKKDCMLRFTKGEPAFLSHKLGKQKNPACGDPENTKVFV